MCNRKDREVFIVENDGKIALFAPMWGLVMEIDFDEKLEVEKLLSKPDFSFEMLFKVFPEIDPDQLTNPVVEEPVVKFIDDFRPTSAALFTTSNCGLRCGYCYSSAGTNVVNMDISLAQATVDFIISNARAMKRDECSLDFLAVASQRTIESFPVCVGLLPNKARSLNINPKVTISTNGMLPETRANWLASHLSIVQVSIDGLLIYRTHRDQLIWWQIIRYSQAHNRNPSPRKLKWFFIL